MPTVRISSESMALLIREAKRLGVTVKDVLDSLILESIGPPIEEEAEEEEEEEEET